MARSSQAGDGLIRFVSATLLLGALGYGGGWVYTNFFGSSLLLQQKQQELLQVQSDLKNVQARAANQEMMIQQMGTDLEDSREQIARLDTSLKLLKTNHRIALVEVVRQDANPQSGAVTTEFRFQEINDQGQPVSSSRTFRVDGDKVYFDYWVVKFADELVESGGEGASSLCLFRRLYGEYQQPIQGYTLDEANTRPAAYGNGPINEYEREIWSNFWTIANDEQLAAGMGIRAAHGEAVYIQLQPGMKYQVLLRASDGLTIRPLPGEQPQQPAV